MTDGKRAYLGRIESACRLAIRVKAGTTGCNITCPELDEALPGAATTYHIGVTGADKKGLFEGEQSNPDKEYDADGNMYLTWYVQISEKNERQYLNFTLTNQLNSQDDYITHFQIKSLDDRLNPLWYCAEGDVATFNPNAEGKWPFKPDGSTSGWYITGPEALQKFSLSTSSQTAWYAGTVRGTDDVLYHLPVWAEWASLIGWENNIFTTPAANTISTEETCAFGYPEARTGITGKSIWGPTGSVRYAIRFLGTQYCSAWRYEIHSTNGLIIKSILIDVLSDANTTENLTLLSSKIAEIASYDWGADAIISRSFTLSGYRSGGNGSGETNTHSSGGAGYRLSATLKSSTDNKELRITPTGLFNGGGDINQTGEATPVRLFRNE